MPRLLAALACLAACAPPPAPAPTPGDGWVRLAQLDGGRTVSYAPASVRPAADGAWEALARLDHATEQTFEGARYTQQDMRVRVRCVPPPAIITTLTDTLRRDGDVVAGHSYGATVWAPITAATPEAERWPLDLCRALAAASDTFPDALGAARAGYVAAWNGTDRVRLAAYFAEDAQVIFPDYTLTGRAQIDTRWLADDVGKVSGLVMTPGRIARDGDEVTEAGSVTLRFRRGDGEYGQETGRYEHVWKLQIDGTWKLRVVRMDTHPVPAP